MVSHAAAHVYADRPGGDVEYLRLAIEAASRIKDDCEIQRGNASCN
jgi:hypothetical protein